MVPTKNAIFIPAMANNIPATPGVRPRTVGVLLALTVGITLGLVFLVTQTAFITLNLGEGQGHIWYHHHNPFRTVTCPGDLNHVQLWLLDRLEFWGWAENVPTE